MRGINELGKTFPIEAKLWNCLGGTGIGNHYSVLSSAELITKYIWRFLKLSAKSISF
jgi:hypothetical protein